MTKFLVCTCLFWLSTLAHACTCETMPLDSAAVQRAQEVFIFRLVSARVLPGWPGQETRIEGRIDVIARLKGSGTFRTMRFSTGRCCGSRFDVGAVFAAFISGPGPGFDAHFGNVLEVGQDHDVQQARDGIAAILKGRRELEEVFPRHILERTEQSPVPTPCPRERSGKDR